MHNIRNTRRVITFGLGIALGLSFLSGTASAAPGKQATAKERGNQGQISSTKDCDGTHHSKTGHGANDSEPHAYNETCDVDVASGNGGGNGEAGGKPCAGCVGNADDKNPQGQYPDGPTDHNNGYECDRKGWGEDQGNNGIGFGNPAHSGCEGDESTGGEEPPACPAAGTAAMTAHSYVVDGTDETDLTGNVDSTDHVIANFTIAGCDELPVTLVAYEFVGKHKRVFDRATGSGSFVAGTYSLNVDTPPCAFAVEFIVDGVVIDSDEDMNASCDKPIIPEIKAAGNPAVVLSAAIEATPVALPAAAVAETPAASIIPDTPAAAVRATEVKGVQLERGAVAGAGLARTGLTLVPLVGFGTALCLLGIALSSARRRDGNGGFIAIGDRIAGF